MLVSVCECMFYVIVSNVCISIAENHYLFVCEIKHWYNDLWECPSFIHLMVVSDELERVCIRFPSKCIHSSHIVRKAVARLA